MIQGITGYEGRFHARKMIEYGTQIVAGVTPCRGGEWIDGTPIFDSVKAAVRATEAEVSLILVPPLFAADAILEAIKADVPLIVCVTEGIPVQDMMKLYDYIARSSVRLLGPSSPGLLCPGKTLIGTMPGEIATPGHVGVVSRSGALTYEVVDLLTESGIGQSVCVGVGADPIVGTSLTDVLEMFENDPETEKIVVLGEIGGSAEINAAQYIRAHMTKPVIAFVAGKSAPEGKRMGHAGAIVAGGEGTAAEKIEALAASGVRMAKVPEDIPKLLRT